MAVSRSTKVFDSGKDVVWIVNLGTFRFPHGLRDGVVFDPQVATRVKMDDWIKGQGGLLVEVADPFNEELPASPVVDPTPLVSQKDGKPVTGVGTGPAGSGNADDVREAQTVAAKKADTKK